MTTAEATVKIIDVNDEPPKFNKREYFAEIPENIPSGMPLPNFEMFVKDPDMVKDNLQSSNLYINKVNLLG